MNYQKSSINWQKFGRRAIELCRKYETNFYIKSDLAKYLDRIPFTNSDTRTVKNPEKKKATAQKGLFEKG